MGSPWENVYQDRTHHRYMQFCPKTNNCYIYIDFIITTQITAKGMRNGVKI